MEKETNITTWNENGEKKASIKTWNEKQKIRPAWRYKTKSKKWDRHPNTKQTPKKIWQRRHETMTCIFFLNKFFNHGCSCDINQTKLEKNYENVVVVVKLTWSCNTIFDCTCRCEIKKEPYIHTYIHTYCSWSCKFNKNIATIVIMALILSSRRNKAHGKGTKLAKTGRYLARHGRLTGFFPSPLKNIKIAMPAKRGWWEPLTGVLWMLETAHPPHFNSQDQDMCDEIINS